MQKILGGTCVLNLWGLWHDIFCYSNNNFLMISSHNDYSNFIPSKLNFSLHVLHFMILLNHSNHISVLKILGFTLWWGLWDVKRQFILHWKKVTQRQIWQKHCIRCAAETCMQYNLVKATIDHLHACQNLIAGNVRLCLLVCASF